MPANDPRLVQSLGLAKAQALEARLNAIAGSITPQLPTILYAGGTTIVTQPVSGSYTWTCPAGVTQAKIECWGAGGSGGGGGSAEGGEAGGGGEYACEPAYTVVPGTVYSYTVGDGGIGGTTGNAGINGGNTLFDGSNVFANGGVAGFNWIGGAGGSGSSNSIANAGGNGGGDNTQGTGGCGAGSSGSPSGAGNNGAKSTSSTGGAGGAGGTDMGPGGAGGNAAANGNRTGFPGGGGGGAGAATGAGSFARDYQPTASATYYGSDATGGNASNYKSAGTLWQGGETASGGSYNGTQKSLFILPSSVASDLSGVTIDKVTLRLQNLSSWYNSGMYAVLGYTGFTSFGSNWGGAGITAVKSYWCTNNAQNVQDLTATGLGAALKSGAAKSLSLGPGTPNYNLYNYGSFWGAGGNTGYVPDLHIEGHTGSPLVQGGSGTDGQVRITFNTPATNMVAALQPIAGADASSNAFAVGYTGPTQTFQPASNPAVVETWHNVTPPNPMTGPLRYKLLPDNTVMVQAQLAVPLTSIGGTLVLLSGLASGYTPANTIRGPVGYFSNGETTVAALLPLLNMRWSANPTGTFSVQAFPGGATGSGITELDICAVYPLD